LSFVSSVHKFAYLRELCNVILGADVCWHLGLNNRWCGRQSYDGDGCPEYAGDCLFCHGRPGRGLDSVSLKLKAIVLIEDKFCIVQSINQSVLF